MSLVWNTKLSSTEKLVLLYYADRASDDGSSIFPAVKTVARNSGLSERTVQYTTKNMIKKGYLIRVGWSDYRTKLLRINISQLLQDQQPIPPQPTNKNQEKDGCNEFTQGVQMNAKKGEPDAHKPSPAINKPFTPRNNSRFIKKGREVISYKYNPTIDPNLKKALQQAKENTQI